MIRFTRCTLAGQEILVATRGGGEHEIRGEAIALRGSLGDDAMELVVQHGIADAKQVWVPHLTPAEGNVAGDAVFRAPAVVIADDEVALAFVVDVEDVARAKGFRAWLDYDHPNRTLVLGAGDYRASGHVFFVREATRAPGAAVDLRLHVLASRDAKDIANPYGMAARWMWSRWARERNAPRPLAPMMDHVLRWAFASGWTESVWQEVDADRGAPVFIVDVTRHPSVPPEKRTWREPRSIWNQAWFSTQRCANGLLRHARRTRDADLERRAHRMTNLTLSAPQSDGLFPSVLRHEEDAWRWTSSDRRPPSVSESAVHLVDAAFTCRMLLEWHALTGDTRARAYVERFADRLVALRRPSGGFPAWIEPDGRAHPDLADSAESAVCATLLFELGRDARATLPLLEAIARDGRWEDFETYWSCAPWGTPGERVARNGVHKQNTLAIAWCAEAFLRAGELGLARRCLDELSLYQAVWDPPFLPAPALGGFGVMNGDSEWNDARQSLFAPLYLEMARATGEPEYLERGAAAMRASFAMLYCPENAALARAYERRFPFFGPESYGFMMENQGHGAAEPIGTFTIFTWGNGSALAAAATIRDRFPEAIAACGLE